MHLIEQIRNSLARHDLEDLVLRRTSSGHWIGTLVRHGVEPRCHDLGSGATPALDECRVLDAAADAKLPLSRALRDTEGRERLAHEIGLDSASEFAIVAYRPEQRILIRATGPNGGIAYLKGFTRKRYARALRAATGVPSTLGPWSFVLQERAIDDSCTIVTRPASGQSLHDLLMDPSLSAGSRYTLLVSLRASLRALESPAWTRIADREPRTVETELESTLRQIEVTMELVPERRALLDPVHRAARHLQDHAARIQDYGHGFVHGDLHDKQLFVSPADGSDPRLVECIDLDGLTHGAVVLDLVNLYEHVLLRERQRGNANGTPQDVALDDAWFHDVGVDRTWITALRVVTRARLAAVYALRSRWLALADEVAETVPQLAGTLR